MAAGLTRAPAPGRAARQEAGRICTAVSHEGGQGINGTSETIAARLGARPRIFVPRLDAIGDCILSAGFFGGLRQLFPAAHITAVFQQETAPLYQSSRLFDEIWRVSGTEGGADFVFPVPFDLAISPRWDVDYWGARELVRRSRAPIRVGFERGNDRPDELLDGSADAYFTDTVPTDSARHEVLKGRDLLMYLGASAEPPGPRLFLPIRARAVARRFRHLFSLSRYVVLAVSARFANRIWPVENFLPVIDMLRSTDCELRFLVVGGADAEGAGRWLQEMRPESVISAAGTLDLMVSAALIAGAALYIGTDSGPMHMAAASGVPVVEISCHPLTGRADHDNSPVRFGPFRTPSRVVRPAGPAEPERAHEPCEEGCHRLELSHCISLVSVAEVIEAVQSLQAEIG